MSNHICPRCGNSIPTISSEKRGYAPWYFAEHNRPDPTGLDLPDQWCPGSGKSMRTLELGG